MFLSSYHDLADLVQPSRAPKGKAIVIVSTDEDEIAITNHQKTKSKLKQTKSGTTDTVPSSGEESDGLITLNAVEEEESKGGVKRGPSSNSHQHWYPPIKLVEPGSAMLWWKFKCHYCNKYSSALSL